MTRIPDTIYLQYDPLGESSWCEDRINETDIEYRRTYEETETALLDLLVENAAKILIGNNRLGYGNIRGKMQFYVENRPKKGWSKVLWHGEELSEGTDYLFWEDENA